MGYPADRWKIEAYLKVLQQVNSDAFTIAGLQQIDSKNALCMIELGFAPADVLEVIKSLTVENYFQGPLPDEKGRPHDLWVFGKEIENRLIYIKITVFFKGDLVSGICVSFHEAECEMDFPYKEAKK